MNIAPLLYITGAFAVGLGVLHFFFPVLFDFDTAIPREGAPLKPFHLGPIQYATKRSDVRGIAWLMNHFVSFNLVAYGIFDLAWQSWIATPFKPFICVWMGLGWLIRAASQLYLGKRKGDLFFLALFGGIGVLHFVAAFSL